MCLFTSWVAGTHGSQKSALNSLHWSCRQLWTVMRMPGHLGELPVLLTNDQSLQPHMYMHTPYPDCCRALLLLLPNYLRPIPAPLPCPCPVLSQCHTMVGYCGSFLTVCLPSFFLFHYLHRNQNDPFKGITLEVVLWVEVPASKPDDLSLSPRTNMVEDNQYRSLT